MEGERERECQDMSDVEAGSKLPKSEGNPDMTNRYTDVLQMYTVYKFIQSMLNPDGCW